MLLPLTGVFLAGTLRLAPVGSTRLLGVGASETGAACNDDGVTDMGDAEFELAVANDREVLDRLEQHLRHIVGERAEVERTSWGEWIPVVHAIPANPRARAIQLVGEQFLHVNVGDHGGQFELSYSLEDEDLAIRLIDAVVAGRVSESVGLTGTTTHVELDSGSVTSETAIAVWKRRDGAWRHSYEPY